LGTPQGVNDRGHRILSVTNNRNPTIRASHRDTDITLRIRDKNRRIYNPQGRFNAPRVRPNINPGVVTLFTILDSSDNNVSTSG